MSSMTSSSHSSDGCAMLLGQVIGRVMLEAEGDLMTPHSCGRDWKWFVMPSTWGLRVLSLCCDDLDSGAGRSDEY